MDFASGRAQKPLCSDRCQSDGHVKEVSQYIGHVKKLLLNGQAKDGKD